MRLTQKLTLALVLLLVMQFGVYGYLASLRQTGFFERDLKNDALHIGHTLAVAVSRNWERHGAAEALALISDISRNDYEMQIRLVYLSSEASDEFRPSLPLETIIPLEEGQPPFKHVFSEIDSDVLFTYVHVSVPNNDHATIELRQSFAAQYRYRTISLLRIIVFLVIVVLTTAAAMWILGLVFVGRPIRKLVEKARRIGQGDLQHPIVITGRDEIALLGRELNAMSEAILRSHKRIDEEMSARVQALEQLRHADRLTTIGTLASGVAHELGTPLTVVAGHIKMLPSIASSPEEISSMCTILSQQVDKMAGIIQQLLNFSRRRTVHKQRSDLSAVVGRVVAMLTPFATKRNISIRYVANEGNVEADLDETQMEQVFTNILVNAMQAMESGEIEVAISSELASNPHNPGVPHSRYHRVSVQDSGSGMSEDQRKQVFDPFFTTKAPGQGTGVGLSIADGIVLEHNGWITVDSTLGKGSRFSVYLPAE